MPDLQTTASAAFPPIGITTAPSVASVTVVFNAADRILRQMAALRLQTRPINEIVVVDNASTDGTAEVIRAQYPDVTILRLPENRGHCGAWAAGIEYAALRRHHDWVWTFDDDSVPTAGALDRMLRISDDAADSSVGILAALPFHPQSDSPYPPLQWRDAFIKTSEVDLESPIVFADLVFASGAMVRRDVVETIGVPRADFFMDFGDFEYCMRARRHGYRIAVIPEAKVSHEVGEAKPVRIFGRQYLWPDHAIWREYYMARNFAYTVWRLYPNWRSKLFVVRHLVRHSVGLLIFGRNKVAGLRRILQGFFDGLNGRLGVRFRPDTTN